MFGFGRKNESPEESTKTADTFVEATDGGWTDSPEVVAGYGGSQASYVVQVLEKAREYALENGHEPGDKFLYKLTDIPRTIHSPHEIVMSLMLQADTYGLRVNYIKDEIVHFVRKR